ncbi:MAG: tRNA (adenosine(37)-N6)-threonylcarbamoyltransferase complex ATPase subunit type 1 TsaE [Candidatus Latescibacteria bacterium]|jgi:tRNA threonylcarbamoyladenosine biosynthesis protein TsaE|nr:tRNA (adenosine(37)-N6)-threonylcarbamoyltransferase complex ATPase subunit type 1 TsaE [Candidatus Latescibacterota bacterium]
MTDKHITESEAGTLEVATVFAATLNPGSVVALIGELGTGKTVFARGILYAFGIKENITSPTFTLIHEYHGKVSESNIKKTEFGKNIHLYHMDLYRMNNVKEIVDIGVEDYFYSGGICLVEWAEKLEELLPKDSIHVTIKHLGENQREIEIERPEKL